MHDPENELTAGQMSNAGIEVAVLDAEGLIVAVNGPWTDFCEANEGNPALTGVGVNYLEVCRNAGDEPGATEVADAIMAALSGGEASADRVLITCHAPHEQRWFDVLVSSRTDGAGRTIGATVMLTQVPEPRTDVVEADHALAREILEAYPDALLIADQHGVIESVNRPAEQLFGSDRESMLGRPLDTFLSGPLSEEPSTSVALRAIRADGYEVPVEVGLSLQDVGGEPRLIAAVRDVTERLREQEWARMVARCIDHLSDAILIFDENSLRFVHANGGAVDMFGYRRSELVDAMSLRDLAPELSFSEIVGSLASLRDAPDRRVRLVTSGRTKRGFRLPVQIQIDWPAATGPNAPRPVVAVVRDLTGGSDSADQT